MQIFRQIKLLLSVVFSLALVGWILVGGVGGAYLSSNPDKAAAYAIGTMQVDPKAGYVDQAQQMIKGYQNSEKLVGELTAAEQEVRDAEFSRKSAGFLEDRYDTGMTPTYEAEPDNSPAYEVPVE